MNTGDLVSVGSSIGFEMYNQNIKDLLTRDDLHMDYMDFTLGIFFKPNETGVILEIFGIKTDTRNTICKIFHESGVIGYGYTKWLRRVE